MYVGLTGTIASGKSIAAKFLEHSGAHTIDLDKVSRNLIAKGGPAYNEIIKTFGNIVLNGEDIDRKKLRSIIFEDKEKRELLETILHPLIRKEEKILVSHIKKKYKNPIIIVHAALLIETESYKRFDSLIVVYADNTKCIDRLMKRDNISKKMAQAILRAQFPSDKKIEYANFIIDNTGDLNFLKKEAERVYNLILLLERSKKMLKKHNKLPNTYYKST